ncbi:MAG: PKD domain-containing protein [Bacteroidota bacterium]
MKNKDIYYVLSLIALLLFKCSSTDEEPLPILDFSSSETQISVGRPIVFQNESVGFENFIWNFGDGNTSTELNPTHTYDSIGTFQISLSGTSISTNQTEIINTNIIVRLFVDVTTESNTFPVNFLIGDAVLFLTNDSDSGAIVWGEDIVSETSGPVFRAHTIDGELQLVESRTVSEETPLSINTFNNRFSFNVFSGFITGTLDFNEIKNNELVFNRFFFNSDLIPLNNNEILTGSVSNINDSQIILNKYDNDGNLTQENDSTLGGGVQRIISTVEMFEIENEAYLITIIREDEQESLVIFSIDDNLNIINRNLLTINTELNDDNRLSISFTDERTLYVNIIGFNPSNSTIISVDINNFTVIDEFNVLNQSGEPVLVEDLTSFDQDNAIILTIGEIILRNVKTKDVTMITDFRGGNAITKLSDKSYLMARPLSESDNEIEVVKINFE